MAVKVVETQTTFKKKLAVSMEKGGEGREAYLGQSLIVLGQHEQKEIGEMERCLEQNPRTNDRPFHLKYMGLKCVGKQLGQFSMSRTSRFGMVWESLICMLISSC